MDLKDIHSIFSHEFNTIDDWKIFQFLCNNLAEFKSLAEDKLRKELLSSFSNSGNWVFHCNHSSADAVWFLKGFNKPEHFKIQLKNCGSIFSISAGNNPYLTQSLSPKLLLDLKYRPLLLTGNFGRIDSISTYKIEEVGNYYFQTTEDGKISNELIPWFAFHKTVEFLNQIKNKVDRFIVDPKLTQLVKDLNLEIDNEVMDFG